MRALGRIALTLLAIWVLVVALGLTFRKTLIYPFRPEAAQPVGVPGMGVSVLTRADGSSFDVWVRQADRGKPVVFYFMGNAGSLAYNVPKLAEFAHAGFGIAAMSYRGGGGQGGAPSEAALGADALLVWDRADALFDAPLQMRVIYGVSLGSGIAVGLAVQRDADGLVLETPFTQMCEAIAHHYPFLPACAVMWDERYPNLDRIGSISAPLLVLHGTNDQVIPVEMGRALHAAHPGPAAIKVYRDGRHNDLRLYGAGIDAIGFINGLGG